jgi:hypothetical protein
MAKPIVKEDSSLIKLEARATNLKTTKIKAEREFIDARARKVTPEEQVARSDDLTYAVRTYCRPRK